VLYHDCDVKTLTEIKHEAIHNYEVWTLFYLLLSPNLAGYTLFLYSIIIITLYAHSPSPCFLSTNPASHVCYKQLRLGQLSTASLSLSLIHDMTTWPCWSTAIPSTVHTEISLFFVIPFCLQYVPVHSANCVKTYTMARRRVLDSAPLQLIHSRSLVAFRNMTYILNLKTRIKNTTITLRIWLANHLVVVLAVTYCCVVYF
jgi:hypothetical protein